MKSPFHLLLSHHRNNHDPERTTTRTNRGLNKIKSLSTGVRGGGDSQSSSTTRSDAKREGRREQEGSMRGKSRSHQYRHGDGRDRHHHSGQQPKPFRNHPNSNEDRVWFANQSVNSLQDTASHAQSTECSTATGKGRSSSSRRMVVRRKQERNDELAATCLAVGATVDTCMNEENGYLLADAIAAYACGYDDDDDDDDDYDDNDDDMYEQRDDSSAVYQTIYQFVQGIAGSTKQTPLSDPVKEGQQEPPGTTQEEGSAPKGETKQAPHTEIRLRTTTPDVRDDVVTIPDYIRRHVFPTKEDNSVATRQESTDLKSQATESRTITESDQGRDASDDFTGTSIQTSSHDGQQQQQLALHNEELNFFRFLFQALSHLTCQEPEWPLGHQSLPSDTPPPNGTSTNPVDKNESSTEASVAMAPSKLEKEIIPSSSAPTEKTDKREKKVIFPRRGRFGRGSRTKQNQTVEPSTQLPCEMVNNLFEQNRANLAPKEIKRSSSAIVTTLVATIEESASC